MSEELFLGVMELQEAKNHQQKLRTLGVELTFKVHRETCTSGCKVTVEVWGRQDEEESIKSYFQKDYLRHVKGHEPNALHLNAVFDPTAELVICQACGTSFAPTSSECPDCGLHY
jgi:rubrerythrin